LSVHFRPLSSCYLSTNTQKILLFKIKAAKGKSVDLFDEDFGDDEELVMLARKFRKIFKSNNENFRSDSKNSVNPINEVSDKLPHTHTHTKEKRKQTNKQTNKQKQKQNKTKQKKNKI
jgi:hypothetical protein